MIKKLLLLLVFAATTIASAQTINVVELNIPLRSDNIFHVYLAEHEDIFEYPEGVTTVTSSFTAESGVLTIGGTEYDMSNSLAVQAIERMEVLGTYGLFFNESFGPDWGVRSGSQPPSFFLPDSAVSEAAFNADPNWYTELDNLGISRWVRDNGCTRYEAVLPRIPGNQWTITWYIETRDPAGFQGWLDDETSSEGVVSAVANHLRTQPVCDTCINTDSPISEKYMLLNDGRGFSDYVPGTTDWIPSGATNTVWTYQDQNGNGLFNQISEVNGQFILYIDVAGDAGGLPTATGTFDCLADLIAAL